MIIESKGLDDLPLLIGSEVSRKLLHSREGERGRERFNLTSRTSGSGWILHASMPQAVYAVSFLNELLFIEIYR